MRVGFLNWQGVALVDPSSSAPFGGAEVRALTFARGLAARPGFEVTVVVQASGPAGSEQHGALRVWREPAAPKPTSWRRRLRAPLGDALVRLPGPPWLGLRHWRADLLWRLPLLLAGGLPGLRRLYERPRPDASCALGPPDLETVCIFGVNDRSACAVAAARRRGLPSVLFVACDHDLSAEYRRGFRHRGPYGEHGHLCRYAIENATAIVVQTAAQRGWLRERFGREGALIRSPIALPAESEPKGERRYALWIGRADTVQKRPDLCLELARARPEIAFRMILNRGLEKGLFERLVAQAPANVEILEQVPYAEIDACFHAAAVLVSTSVLEGFPNVFLQAGRHGVPILSWQSDPDGFLVREGCGIVAGGRMERMIAGLRELWSDKAAAATMGRSCRRHVETWHGLEGRTDELVALLENFSTRRRARESR